jgi:Radical SAM superfamily
MPLNRRQYWEAISRAEPSGSNFILKSEKIAESFNRSDIRLIIVNVAAYDYTNSPLRCVPHNLRPPIGLFALEASVSHCEQSCSQSVCVVDMEKDRLAPADLAALVAHAQSLSQFRIIVGLNGYSPNRAVVEKVASALRSMTPDSRLLLGGRLISIELDPRVPPPISPQESLLGNAAESAEVCAIVGEGERLLPWLFGMKRWERNDVCFEPAVAWGSPGNITLPSKFESLSAEALSKIAFDPPSYIATAGGGEEYYAMLSSRSCPFHCSFCAANYFPVRILPISFIETQIEQLSHGTPTVRIDFCDDNVLMSEKRSREFIEMMERLNQRGIRVVWRALARGDSVLRLHKAGYIERAAEAGLEEVAIGLETTSDRLLTKMSKDLEFSEVDRAVESLGKSKIRAKMFALIGIPTETESEAIGTIRYLSQRAREGHRWSLFVQAPYAGTADHRQLLEDGWTYWDLQLYTEAASRGGQLIDEVDRAGIQLANSKLGELYRLVEEVSGTCSYKDGGGEDCCAASCDEASRQAALEHPISI